MLWLRTLLFVSPLVLAFGATLLFRQVSRLELSRETDALTCAIREPVGYLNPLAPQTGVTREITDLVFDPLLVRDGDFELQPHILDSWQFRTVVTIRCASEEAAGDAEARLRAGEYLAEGMTLLGLDRVGSVLTVVLEGFGPDPAERLLDRFDPAYPGDFLLVRLEVRNSVRESFESFLGQSVEKGRIKMLDYDGDTAVNLFLGGDTDSLLEELNLYYESNRSLEPEIEVVGERCHTSVHEAELRLRRDVRWHDGASLTVDDVLFSYETLTQPDSPLPLASSFRYVERIEKLDDHRLLVICGDTPATLMESWEKLPVLPAHLLGGEADRDTWTAFFESPVGCGPYRVARPRLRGGGIELVANESYFPGAPLQKRLVYREFESLEAKLLALRSGRIDTLVPDRRFRDWAERNPGVVRRLRCRRHIQHFVAWNLDRPPLDRREVRLALARAVDLDAVLRDTATRFQAPVKSLFHPAAPWVDEPMPLPSHDLAAAEKLLEENGYSYDERRGVRVDDEGEPFALRLTVNQGSEEQKRLARSLANQWAAIGVAVEIEPRPWSEILEDRLRPRDFDAVMLTWELPRERDRWATWHSGSAGGGGGNVFGLESATVDERVERLHYATEPEAVERAATRLQREIARLQPCLFVCDSGRILWLRENAIEVRRPGETGEEGGSEPAVGELGLERVRPWWVRKDGGPEEAIFPGGER